MILEEKDKITSALVDTVKIISQAEDRKNNFYNITVMGTILERDLNKNEYIISYNGNKITALPIDSSKSYLLGTKVMVLVPNGDFSLKKFILSEY